MQKFITLILHVNQTIRVYGKYEILLYIALLYLALRHLKQKSCQTDTKNKWDLRICLFGVLGFAILWNPVLVMLIIELMPEFVDYWRLLWVIPEVGILAYAGTKIITDSYQSNHKKYMFYSNVIAMIALIALSGTVNPFYSKSLATADNIYGIPDKDMQVLQYWDNTNEEITILATNAIIEEARRYNGRIKTIYGRDLWSTSAVTYRIDGYDQVLYPLYEWMQSPTGNEEAITKSAAKLKCNYLVVSNGRLEQEGQGVPRDPNAVLDLSVDPESWSLHGYQLVRTTDYYHIFKLEEME